MSVAGLTAALADRYTIARELGHGGMATVYLAHDIKHDRDVAIKVLRPELAAVIGAKRFLVEIRTTANLQHPHILPLFDSGAVYLGPAGLESSDADGSLSALYYVMPFIDGMTLRDRMTRDKQLPVAEAVRIATEVAGALDYAHRHGVIHRDIKPENIMLHDGTALVADFGIALAASKAGARMTESGISLGTPQYMSPEQAMGERELDARSDVFALGCMTYEMLTGEPPFNGPTAQAIAAKVMTTDPVEASALRKTIPPAVADAVHTALQKLPADRFDSTAAFAAALNTTVPARFARARHTGTRAAAQLAAWASVMVLLAVAIFFLGGRIMGRHGTAGVVLGRATHLTWDNGLEITPALSPDGRAVAYATGPIGNLHVMVRNVSGGRSIPITGDTANPEYNPTWLGDGSRILFLSRGGVFSAPVGGGPARPEVPGTAAAPITSVTSSPDATALAFTRDDSLFIRHRDAATVGVARMAEPTLCTWSPTGTFIACATGDQLYSLPTAYFGNLAPSRIMLCRVRDGHITTVTDSTSLNTSPTWSPDGKTLYFVSNRDGRRDIYGVAVNGNGEAGGPAFRLSAGLGAHTISSSIAGGTLAFSQYSDRSSLWSMPLPTRAGMTTTGATRVTNADEYIETFNGSRDGKWLYYDSDLPGDDDIFRAPVGGGEPERLTDNPSDDFAPAPSPDGRSFAFHSWRTGSRDIFVQQLDGSGVTQVTHSPAQEAQPVWSPDGQALAYSNLSGAGGIWVVARRADGTWGAPVQRVAFGSSPAWSPDGRLLAFLAGRAGGSIDVIAPDSGPPHAVIDITKPGMPFADFAVWADSKTVLFLSHDGQGNRTIYSIAAAGGTPVPFVRFDPALHPGSRGGLSVADGRIFINSEDRQSDIWLIELKHP
ncbi:MAG TPA: protein kinase [Gemmatimonadales bacterium]